MSRWTFGKFTILLQACMSCAVACTSSCGAEASSLLQSGFNRDKLRPESNARQEVVHESTDACESAFVTFEEFVDKHKRRYKRGSAEYEMRRELYLARIEEFKSHNCRPGRRLWTAGVTTLTDRTDAELARLRGRKGHGGGMTSGGKVPVSGGTNGARLAALATSGHAGNAENLRPIPAQFDEWSGLMAMQQVIDQGSCGSCWASASAVMLRAHTDIYHTQDMPFSVQQLVSCVPNPEQCGGNGGCNGSTGELALDYVMNNGLTTVDQFAYQDRDSHQGVPCPAAMVARNAMPTPQPNGTAYNRLPTLSANQTDIAAAPLVSNPMSANLAAQDAQKDYSAAKAFGMLGWSKLPVNKVEPLYRAVYQEGPVAVSITAGYSWNSYVSGIMDNCTKEDMVVNHLVVLTGWGFDYDKGEMIKYWTLQNSWGTNWGENGFIRMIRQNDDQKEEEHCGWDNDPQIGTGCAGGPSKVWVCGSCGILYDSVVAHFEGSTPRAQDMAQRRL